MNWYETAVIDPEEFIENRSELPLDDIGLHVRQGGANWGDADHEAFMIKQALGEIPADRHAPNRKVSIPILAHKRYPNVSLAEALYRLQLKVGTLQEKGGWIRRDMKTESGFAVSVGMQVHTAVLSGIQGWMMTHREVAPEIVLILTTGPYFYSASEIQSGEVTEESKRFVEYILEDQVGTVKGLRRTRIKNLNASSPWRTGILAEECDDAPEDFEDPTAQLHYFGNEVTFGSETTETGTAFQNKKLTAGWKEIASSETAEGHLTHKGVRKLLMRLSQEKPSETEVQLIWRALGASEWNEDNDIIAIRTDAENQIYDLGECRPKPPVIGEPRWEWKLMGRSLTGSGTIKCTDIYVLPTEQYTKIIQPYSAPIADKESQKSPASGSTFSDGIGTAWSSPENIKSQDKSNATCKIGNPIGYAYTDYIFAKNFSFGLPEGAIVIDVLAEVYCDSNVEIPESQAIPQLNVFLFLDTTEELTEEEEELYNKQFWGASTYKSMGYGSAPGYRSFASFTQPRGPLTVSVVNSSSFGFAAKMLTYKAGKEHTMSVDHMRLTIAYTEASAEDRICFAERMVEIRSDGAYRQHITDDVWGEQIPFGFFPYATPPGLENKPSRGIFIPSQGDLDEIADEGTNKIRITTYTRPAYHFTSEAA